MQPIKSGAILRSEVHAPARQRFLERKLDNYRPEIRDAIGVLAREHTRLADLADSFPALLFALAKPRPRFDPRPVISLVIDGRSLPELAIAAELPLWLRKFRAEGLHRPIPRLRDSEVLRRRMPNHLPRSPKIAPVWLDAISMASERASDEFAVWCARNIAANHRRAMIDRMSLLCLWSWFSCHPETHGYRLIDKAWNPGMNFQNALNAALNWHDTVDLHLNLGDGGVESVWLRPATVEAYEFVPLSSVDSLIEEARAMKNCVRAYGSGLVHDHSRIWSIRKDGQRVATVEVGPHGGDPLLGISELKAAKNAEAELEVWWAARQWLNSHDRTALEYKPVAWDATPLHRDVWASLWKPYWLAKRKIPQWLPLWPSRCALGAL